MAIFHEHTHCSIPAQTSKEKTPGLEIFKVWYTIFVPSKLTEVLQFVEISFY